MVRLFSTACLVLVVIVLFLSVAEGVSDRFQMERIYTSLHLVGAFWIGVIATALFSRRISALYNRGKKEVRRGDGP